jgi:hypothetical protein
MATGSFSRRCFYIKMYPKLKFYFSYLWQQKTLNCGNKKHSVATKVTNVAMGVRRVARGDFAPPWPAKISMLLDFFGKNSIIFVVL